MNPRNRKGVTLGLMPFIILLMTVIGLVSFYIAQFFGGSNELVNATDAGALAAARKMVTIGLSQSEVSALPLEFQALGVDSSGTPTGIDPNTGLPNTKNAIFNVYAFNRAAGYTLLVALNAAEDGSQAGINNANALITALNKFGTQLNNDLLNTPGFANTFSTVATANNTSMLGNHVLLGNNDQLQFASVPGDGIGKANVYFNSSIYSNDPTLQNWIQQITVNSGITSQPNSRYNANDPSAQSGQPFVAAYQTLDISKLTGVQGFTTPIYTCAVNPSQLPHLINLSRFSSPNTPAQCYAPTNSISAQGQATESHSKLLCTALGCAMLGAYDNQYPISMPYGWIRIKNNPDAIAANQGQSPTVASVPLWVDGSDNIFNNELWVGPGGQNGIIIANNGVFCTDSYSNPNNPYDIGPPGYTGLQEMTAWITYTSTPVSNPNNTDQYGHDSTLDPSRIQANGNYLLGYQSPTCNMRYSSNYQQLATVDQMRTVTSIVAQCESTMYTTSAETPPECNGQNLTNWVGNYHNGSSGSSGEMDTGTQPIGGLTNLEYLKGEVIGQFWNILQQTQAQGMAFLGYSFNLVVPQNPSGSKLYDRSNTVSYATPSGTKNVAFGTIGTPAQLINQLYQNSASCANVQDDNQWNNVKTPLGKLLQRCQQILPSTTSSDIITLLNTYPINLNQYQYIYLPNGGTKLTISNSPPSFLGQLPEFQTPGATIADGSTVLTCSDNPWTEAGSWSSWKGQQIPEGVIGNAVNADFGMAGNGAGDAGVHGQPFQTFQGNLNTYDAVNFVPNSGRNNFLGELSFGNYVNGTSGFFAQPN